MLFRVSAVIGALLGFARCELEPNNASVIIIGAGASGIAAATKLQENGFVNVQVIEAEDRIGGRVNSVDFGEALVDLGAEYCHGQKGNVVFDMAKHMLNSYEPEYVLYYSKDGQEIGIDIHESLFKLAHNVIHRKNFNASKSDMCAGLISIGHCLKVQFDDLMDCSKADERELLKSSYPWLRSYKSATESCLNLDDVSLISNYEECPGDQMLNWGGRGFKMIFYIMTRQHQQQQAKDKKPSIAVLLNNTVTSIVNWQNGSHVSLNLKSGQTYSAKHVIFTPSLGVLKANHQKLFSPPLPQEKAFAINHIGYGDIVKIALYFENTWWTANGNRIFGCIWNPNHQTQQDKENLTWTRHFTGFTPVQGNPKVLMAWFAGEACPSIELLSNQDILNGIRFILAKCFVTYSQLTMPKKVVSSKWWHNPNFRGTFSYDSVKGFESGDENLREKLGGAVMNEAGVPSLLFAGEATHRTMFATVHGAIETGYREAQRIIDYYRNLGNK